MISRYVYAAGCTACLAFLAACERHPGAAAPRLAPSPAANVAAAAAVSRAPADDVRQASAALAEAVSGWEQPQAALSARKPRPTDAAALAAASSPSDLAAAMAALNAAVRGANAPARQGPPR